MKPSEMTNDELRLAIAEKLDKYCSCEHPHFSYDRTFGNALPNCNNCDKIRVVPDYPGDNNAALGLLEGMRVNIRLYEDGRTSVFIFGSDYHARGKSLPRAICEAWLDARRNDG